MQFADTFSLCHRFMLYNLRLAACVLILPLGLAGIGFAIPVALATVCALLPCVLCQIVSVIIKGDCGDIMPDDCEDFIWKFAALGLWPLGLALGLTSLATFLATAVACLPILLLCHKCGCLNGNMEDVATAMAIWPFLIGFVCLTIGISLAMAPLTLPIALWYHCQSRPPLNQDDDNLGA